jgi:hypothetical protein
MRGNVELAATDSTQLPANVLSTSSLQNRPALFVSVGNDGFRHVCDARMSESLLAHFKISLTGGSHHENKLERTGGKLLTRWYVILSKLVDLEGTNQRVFQKVKLTSELPDLILDEGKLWY